MAEKLAAPRGTLDVLPDECGAWQCLEAKLRDVAGRFSFQEIRFPTFEHTALFVRGVGSTTDVVQKEMYTFEDKGGRSVTLRPEGTASVVRAFVEHSLHAGPLPLKVYYIAPNFRYEKPQAGRLREHHQFGVECLGAASPAADAEVIALARAFMDELRLRDIVLRLNSLGCPSCRPQYQEALLAFLTSHRDKLCATCQDRFQRNPLRILDCKNPECGALVKEAPVMQSHLCGDCADHQKALERHLDAMGIAFSVDPFIVRGLDYYTRTVFEFTTDCIGAQSTICGGGRYDGLVETLGGPAMPALGFGSGLERLLLVMDKQGVAPNLQAACDLYIASMGEGAALRASTLAGQLRAEGFAVERDLMGRSLKAQMKSADRIDARYTLVLGDEELLNGSAVLKRMDKSREDHSCALEAQSIALWLRD